MERSTIHIAENLSKKSGKTVFITEEININEQSGVNYSYRYVWAQKLHPKTCEIHTGNFTKEKELRDHLSYLHENFKNE